MVTPLETYTAQEAVDQARLKVLSIVSNLMLKPAPILPMPLTLIVKATQAAVDPENAPT